MSSTIETTAVPTAIEHKLQRIRWRQTGLAGGRALMLAATVLIAAMFVAMLADWWFTFFEKGDFGRWGTRPVNSRQHNK